jgi:hypothetical protein
MLTMGRLSLKKRFANWHFCAGRAKAVPALTCGTRGVFDKRRRAGQGGRGKRIVGLACAARRIENEMAAKTREDKRTVVYWDCGRSGGGYSGGNLEG